MQLIELRANKPSFKTVRFNKTGLSIILGKKQDPTSRDQQKTYNGVGKSLIIEIIHFCLGSNSIEAFKKLPEWEFTLEFVVNGQKYISSRSTDNQKVLLLNGKKYNCTSFRNLFESEIFYIAEKIENITFRSLLPRFIRRGRKNYNSYDKYDESETPYQKLLRNAFLLGLDTTKIIRKYELKKELDNIENFKSNIEKDTFLRDFLTDSNKIDINIIDLEENINILQNKIDNFEVAEDYKSIKEEANAVDYELRSLDNKIVVYQNAIKNIDKSLEVKPDIAKERIFDLYNEAQITLPDIIKKNISEVESFHNQLLDNRIRRLLNEKSKIEKIIYSLTDSRKNLEKNLNDKLKYLSKYGALEEYTALTNKLNDLKFQLAKLQQYEEVLEKYKNKVSELKIAFETENLSTNKYLKDAKTIIDKNISTFRSLSRAFYKDKPGGIEVINNEGENQVRFNINAHIQDDSSDGINEVKIFCFDFTLLISKYNHKMDFIFHDSRLLANMDPRQRATLFKVANEQTLHSSLQYIISVNEDALNSIMGEYLENEYKEIIEKNIILNLTDESAESKLLGINVDIDYEN